MIRTIISNSLLIIKKTTLVKISICDQDHPCCDVCGNTIELLPPFWSKEITLWAILFSFTGQGQLQQKQRDHNLISKGGFLKILFIYCNLY